MKEYDRVELTIEKESYAKYGVHKGMNGIICHPNCVNGTWLVSFDQYGELPEIACISIKETDLIVMCSPSEYDVKNNTKIAEYWAKHKKSPDSKG